MLAREDFPRFIRDAKTLADKLRDVFNKEQVLQAEIAQGHATQLTTEKYNILNDINAAISKVMDEAGDIGLTDDVGAREHFFGHVDEIIQNAFNLHYATLNKMRMTNRESLETASHSWSNMFSMAKNAVNFISQCVSEVHIHRYNEKQNTTFTVTLPRTQCTDIVLKLYDLHEHVKFMKNDLENGKKCGIK